jgi:hypothetical protein
MSILTNSFIITTNKRTLNSVAIAVVFIDFTMGGMLKALRRQGVQHLGYRSMGDFSVEHLSFSGRLASEMMRNFDVLSKLPLTKKAYLQCEIMKSALRHISRVTAENEAEWLLKAQTFPLNELIDEVRKELEKKKSCGDDSGSEDMEVEAIGADCCFSENGSMSPVDITRTDFPSEESDEQGNGVMMHFNVKPKLALVWDFALSHFRDCEQYGGSISEFIDALLGNYLSSAGRKREGRNQNIKNPQWAEPEVIGIREAKAVNTNHGTANPGTAQTGILQQRRKKQRLRKTGERSWKNMPQCISHPGIRKQLRRNRLHHISAQTQPGKQETRRQAGCREIRQQSASRLAKTLSA